MRVEIREEELVGWTSTGRVFRAYDADTDVPLYLGSESRDECEKRVRDNYPKAEILSV